jgi:hypothetical protein
MGLFDSKSISDDEEVRGNPHPQSPTHSCETLIVVCCADDVVVRAACDNGESPLSGDGMLRIIARSLLNSAPWRGFVKKSPTISLVGQYSIVTSPFDSICDEVVLNIDMSCSFTA